MTSLRSVCSALLVALLLLLLGGAVQAGPPGLGPLADPGASGPFAVGRASLEATDASRGRTLPLDVWYPVDPQEANAPPSVYDLIFSAIVSELALDSPLVSTSGPFPLVVFSHGNSGIRYQSYFLCEHLASHGFVVLAPDHVGNTAIDLVFPGTPFEPKDRPLDVSFAISWILAKNQDAADDFYATVDPARIGVAGHSFGAFTALTMASGFQDVPPDPRVRAILPIAPASGILSDEELASITLSAFILGGTADDVTPIDPQSTRAFELVSSRPAYRVDVLDAGHNSFTNICDFFEALSGTLPDILLEFLLGTFDQGCAPELIPIEEAHRLTRLYATAFLQDTVAGDGRYGRFLNPGFARKERDVVYFFTAGRRP